MIHDQRLPSPTASFTTPYRRPSPIPPSTYSPPSPTSPLVNKFEQRRRSLISTLNSRYIYGRIPLLHSIIFLCEMALVSLLIQRFNLYYARRPILTTMIANAVLGGVADTVAQSLTAIRFRGATRKARTTSRDDAAIDLQDFDSKSEWTPPEYRPAPKNLPPPFDFERLTRFMSYGFLMAPLQYKWFAFLSRAFPMKVAGSSFAAFERVALDQLIFAPMGLGVFFAFMTVAEGGGRRAIIRKLQDVYIPALKANYLIWPAVQMVNFRFMPIQLQIPFVSTVGIAWTAYLSLTNASEEPESVRQMA